MESRRAFLQKIAAGTVLSSQARRAVQAADSPYPDLAACQATRQARGIIAPNKTYRMMEWEFHNPPEATFDIDVEAAMTAARDAGAESVMIYAQDVWGYAFYPTDVGVRHPNLNYDLFGQEVELAHKLGMSVVCYYSLEWNHQIVQKHPDWGWKEEDGEQCRLHSRWFMACPESPYRNYVLGMLDEVCTRYEIEELFFDTFGSAVYHFCYCPYTVKAWNEGHPNDPYHEGFKTRSGWQRRYQWIKRRTISDLLDEIIEIGRRHRPKLLFSINGGPEFFDNEVMQKVSFIYAEPLPCPTGIALGSILMRGWGRPYYQAGLSVGPWPKEGYVDDFPGQITRTKADALMVQNARTFFVANSPIVGGIDGKGFSNRWFQSAKETWKDVREVDCLLGPDLEPVCSSAMLYSEGTRQELATQTRSQDFRHSYQGALETMTYAGRPVESIPDFRLHRNELDQFELLVLPEVEVLSDDQADVIRTWVENGGTLVATHRCGLVDENQQPRADFPLADVLGLHLVREVKEYAYDKNGQLKERKHSAHQYTPTTYLESTGHTLARRIADSTVALPGSFVQVNTTTATEVMRFRLPLMVEELPNKWFDWGPPPPGPKTGGTAVSLNRYGQGQAVYVGAPIFWAMHDRPYWIQNWVPDLIRQLVPDPVIELRAEPFTQYFHGTCFFDRARGCVLVQILNTSELALEGESRPIPQVCVRANPAKLLVTGARAVWPRVGDLPLQHTAGRTQIEWPNLDRYAAFLLRMA